MGLTFAGAVRVVAGDLHLAHLAGDDGDSFPRRKTRGHDREILGVLNFCNNGGLLRPCLVEDRGARVTLVSMA